MPFVIILIMQSDYHQEEEFINQFNLSFKLDECAKRFLKT